MIYIFFWYFYFNAYKKFSSNEFPFHILNLSLTWVMLSVHMSMLLMKLDVE
jgi:hypothetical protein